MDTASVIDASVALVEWQIDALGVVGVIAMAAATALWSCCAGLIVGEWRRFRRRPRP